jgi:hypothetical protein
MTQCTDLGIEEEDVEVEAGWWRCVVVVGRITAAAAAAPAGFGLVLEEEDDEVDGGEGTEQKCPHGS